MGRYTGPQCRFCRAEKRKLYLKGDRCMSDKCPVNRKRGLPGRDIKARPQKTSDYGVMLREKQKVKRLYGMIEKQFKIFFVKAAKLPGMTGENLLNLLERRLDNVVYRMHFASSRKSARQLVSHGHIRVNGKKVTIPSYIVRQGVEIEVCDKGKKLISIKESLKELAKSGVMPWMEVNADEMKGRILAVPRRNDLTDLADIRENLIVELYSK